MIKRIATGLAVAAGVVVLSAVPADAAPREPGDRGYLGPLTSAHFAGVRTWSCVFIDTGVFILPTEYRCHS